MSQPWCKQRQNATILGVPQLYKCGGQTGSSTLFSTYKDSSASLAYEYAEMARVSSLGHLLCDAGRGAKQSVGSALLLYTALR